MKEGGTLAYSKRDSVFKQGREGSKENWEEKIDWIVTVFLALKRKCVLIKKGASAVSSEGSSVTQFRLFSVICDLRRSYLNDLVRVVTYYRKGMGSWP